MVTSEGSPRRDAVRRLRNLIRFAFGKPLPWPCPPCGFDDCVAPMRSMYEVLSDGEAATGVLPLLEPLQRREHHSTRTHVVDGNPVLYFASRNDSDGQRQVAQSK